MNRPGFELIRREPVPSLSLYVEEYRHRRTGARHYHLVASDINNAFLVAFTTVPQDSTGVAHILEHTSLCGSQRFPVRDPFFMMSRRSLSTFMNAFTASDWTAYPFASQNRKDFNNLLEVFLDAVFFPKLDPLDFAQEGHRIEFQRASEPSSQLVHKGVVYNEMKGAMSSPPRAVWDKLYFYLFPTTTYHYNSGGDPAQIPELTYEQLKAFHARHYHPSNAVFMTYGDIPAIEHHQQFEALALSRFSAAEGPHLTVPEEHRYHAPITVTDRYALDGNEATEHRTHIVLGWLLGNSADLDAVMDAHLLSGVLLDNSSSPLRNALETSALGSAPSELCGLDDSLRETTFIAGLEGSDPEHAGSVEELILDVLEDVTRRGVPREQIESVLHQIELSQREITGGTFPYGLRLMVNVLTPILHGGDAIAALAIDPVLERLRRAILDPEYIPELTRRLLIENPHRVRLVMTPDTDLGRRREAVEAERLATLAASMNEADRQRLIEAAKALAERQKTQDDPSILPKVELTDVPPELRIVEGEE
jgi:Zn-dependent M16 (insulinase) family peptidase